MICVFIIIIFCVLAFYCNEPKKITDKRKISLAEKVEENLRWIFGEDASYSWEWTEKNPYSLYVDGKHPRLKITTNDGLKYAFVSADINGSPAVFFDDKKQTYHPLPKKAEPEKKGYREKRSFNAPKNGKKPPKIITSEPSPQSDLPDEYEDEEDIPIKNVPKPQTHGEVERVDKRPVEEKAREYYFAHKDEINEGLYSAITDGEDGFIFTNVPENPEYYQPMADIIAADNELVATVVDGGIKIVIRKE